MNQPLSSFRWSLCAVLLLLVTGLDGCSKKDAWPAPDKYFSDYVGTLTPKQRTLLNNACTGFEISTSIQFLVVYDKALPPKASLQEYCHRVAASWKIGQKAKDNGVVLFVFAESKEAYIDVGRGLQSVLTPAACEGIVNDKIHPKLETGDDYEALYAGIEAVMEATEKTSKGDGRAYYQERINHGGDGPTTGNVFLDGIIALGLAFLLGAAYFLLAPLLNLLASVFSVLNLFTGGVTLLGGGGKFSSGGGSSFGGGGGASGSW